LISLEKSTFPSGGAGKKMDSDAALIVTYEQKEQHQGKRLRAAGDLPAGIIRRKTDRQAAPQWVWKSNPERVTLVYIGYPFLLY
jgi:hypothetical protein